MLTAEERRIRKRGYDATQRAALKARWARARLVLNQMVSVYSHAVVAKVLGISPRQVQIDELNAVHKILRAFEGDLKVASGHRASSQSAPQAVPALPRHVHTPDPVAPVRPKRRAVRKPTSRRGPRRMRRVRGWHGNQGARRGHTEDLPQGRSPNPETLEHEVAAPAKDHDQGSKEDHPVEQIMGPGVRDALADSVSPPPGGHAQAQC